MGKRTKEKECPHCDFVMSNMISERFDGDGDGGGWWWCTPCEIETLPVWYGFQMYDYVELVGTHWSDEDQSKIYATIKGAKDGKLGVSHENFFGYYPPEYLKLVKRREGDKWIKYD